MAVTKGPRSEDGPRAQKTFEFKAFFMVVLTKKYEYCLSFLTNFTLNFKRAALLSNYNLLKEILDFLKTCIIKK